MRRVFLSVLLMGLCLSNVSLVAAQTNRVKEAIQKIPVEGRTTGAFVPRGWIVHSQAGGDLNGDGIADAALTLSLPADEAEKLKSKEGDAFEWPPYIVLVLFGQASGGFRRFAVNGQLYPSHTGDGPLDLKIARGVLITNQNYRDGWAVDATFRFRYEATTKKLMLIGFDLMNYSRVNDYEGRKTSENYLTGLKIDYAKGGEPGSSAYKSVGQSTIKRYQISFDEAQFNDSDDDLFNIRPYGETSRVTQSARPSTGGISGAWEWLSRPNRQKQQTSFSLDIKQAGNKISGTYWFNQIGPDEGSDASFVPFVGVINGDRATIEFDPADIHGIEEENVRYKKPRVPSTATLTLSNGKLIWALASGKVDAGDLGIPREVTLSRTK